MSNLKSINNNLSKLLSSSEKELIRRENYLSKKSESWQDSPKGEEYSSNSDMLRELIDYLKEAQQEFIITYNPIP